MSGKLDQSLDQIMSDTKPAGGRRGRPAKTRPARRAGTRAKAAIAAPTGGVQKTAKAAKATSNITAPTTDSKSAGSSKIIVSNLPEDVTETQIKDFFGKSIGRTRQVLLTYGPSGRSRGVATILFADSTAGALAAKQLDGVKVDNRAMKIEVVLGAKEAPKPQAPKSLADRVAQPKNAAKENAKTAAKQANGKPATDGATKSGRKRPGRAGRPKKKTAEELDADMMDYFGGDSGPTNGATSTAAATNGGDTGMVDEVM